MPIYKCRVKKGVNEPSEQRIDAGSEKEAIEKLSQMGLMPLHIAEVTEKDIVATQSAPARAPEGRGRGRGKVKLAEITVFTREMASLFKSGVPILTALEIIREQSENLNFKQIVGDIHDAVKEGSTFSAALGKYPRVFPPIYIAMIKTGENSGALPEVLLSIADYRRKEQEMASRFRMALAYPALMGLVGLGTIVFMFTYVIPRLSKIYVNLGEALPLPTRILLATSGFLRKGWPVIILVLAVGIFIFRRQINTAAGKKVWSQFLLRLPLVGKFIIKAELTRFCRTFGLLIRSGVPILTAINIAVPVIENEVIKEQISRSYQELEHGGTLGKSLKNAPVVPLFMSNLVRVGEESGKLQDALEEVASSYERDTEEAVRIMSSLLEPLMILVMGLVTGFIVIAMLLPIFDINAMNALMERMDMIQRPGKTFWPGILLGIILASVLCAGSVVGADKPNWKELKGTHFIVYFSGEESFARDVLNSAERYYTRIAADLGYARYQDFWTWEKRCKVYVYPDHGSFLKSTGGAEWSHGLAEYNTKTIYSYAWHEGFLDSLLPHEIAHLIFRDFIGFKGEVPLWLDEGVAQWEEEAKRPQMKAMIKELYEKDGLLLINDMMKLDIRRLKDKEGVHVRAALTKDGSPGVVFLSSDNLVNTYYLQSVSMIGFLIEKYGGESFTIFCRELRDGASLEDALRSAYTTITTIAEFEKRWKEYLDQL